VFVSGAQLRVSSNQCARVSQVLQTRLTWDQKGCLGMIHVKQSMD